MDEVDPRQIILEFLTKLPDTIRDDVLVSVVVYAAGRQDLSGESDVLKMATEYLFPPSSLAGFGAAVCVAGMMDYVLTQKIESAGWDRTARAAEIMAKTFPGTETSAARVIAGIPLRRRHFEQAWRDWQELRRTKLTYDDLSRFERKLLGIPPEKPA